MKYILCLSSMFALPSSAQNYSVQECVIENGTLKTINVDYDPATGDKSLVVNGKRKLYSDVNPPTGPGYAGAQAWYINSEGVLFNKKTYQKYGLPRILGVTEIVKSGVYKGIGVYTEAGLKGPVEVIYIPVRQGCEFQPYQIDCGGVKIEKGKVTATSMEFKARLIGVTGKPSYAWVSDKAPIIKGQGTAKIIVNTKNKKDKDAFGIEIKVNEKSSCPLNTRESFSVSRKN